MKRVALFSALLLLTVLCAVGIAVWLASGRTGETLLAPDEVRILSCTDDGSGTLLLTVAVTKEGYGFSRFEARRTVSHSCRSTAGETAKPPER